MHIKTLLYLSLLSCLMACGGRQRPTKSSITGFIAIDATKDYPQKDIVFQDIAEIEYVLPETHEDALLDGSAWNRLCMSDSLLVTCNNADGSVFVFDRKGKFLHSFNHLGKGGENEYWMLEYLAVDFKEKEIFISAAYLQNKICVYTLDGTLKRILKLPTNYEFYKMIDHNAEYLLCYQAVENTGSVTRKYPYLFISKKDGKITPLELSVPQTVIPRIYSPKDDEFWSTPFSTLTKNGDETLVAEYGCDTIYRLHNNILRPFIQKIPAQGWKKTIPLIGHVWFWTDRYVFMQFAEMFAGHLLKNLVHDRKTGETFEFKASNADFPSHKMPILPQNEWALPTGYVHTRLLPSELKKANEQGLLSGKLKEITINLEEDANPLLVLIKFKE